MDESPVINDSDEFIPMGAPNMAPAPAASPVINGSDEFIPMPTPDQVVHQDDATRRLDAVPFEFADIRALAQRILKRAQEQGQAKIDSARKQVEAMEKQAYDKAYKEAYEKAKAEGLETGRKEGMAESDKKVNQAIEIEKESMRQNAAPVSGVLQELADALNASRQQLIAQAEGDLLLLALDLAKRLVGHELSVDPEAIRPLVTECIDLVTDRTSIDVRVNPEDHRVIDEFYPELKTIFPDLGPVKIISDPQIERGGLYAATREAEVDMRLATRLAAFEEVILGFSGDAAVAPWNQIPADAIAAAKAANAESPYSLMMDDVDDVVQDAPRLDMATAPEEGGVSPEELQAARELMDGEGEGMQLPEDGGQMERQDIADLAELADLAGGEEEPPPQQ